MDSSRLDNLSGPWDKSEGPRPGNVGVRLLVPSVCMLGLIRRAAAQVVRGGMRRRVQRVGAQGEDVLSNGGGWGLRERREEEGEGGGRVVVGEVPADRHTWRSSATS